jgi:hypothetical protein
MTNKREDLMFWFWAVILCVFFWLFSFSLVFGQTPGNPSLGKGRSNINPTEVYWLQQSDGKWLRLWKGQLTTEDGDRTIATVKDRPDVPPPIPNQVYGVKVAVGQPRQLKSLIRSMFVSNCSVYMVNRTPTFDNVKVWRVGTIPKNGRFSSIEWEPSPHPSNLEDTIFVQRLAFEVEFRDYDFNEEYMREGYLSPQQLDDIDRQVGEGYIRGETSPVDVVVPEEDDPLIQIQGVIDSISTINGFEEHAKEK